MVKEFSSENDDSFYSSNHYFKLIRRLSIFIGIWPYETGTWHMIRSFLSFFLFNLLFVGQIPAFFTMEYTIQTVAESFFIFGQTLSIASIYYIINVIKYNHVIRNLSGSSFMIKLLFNHIKYDWYNLKTTQELTIIEEYAKRCRLNTLLLLFVCFIPVVGQIFVSTISSTLNFVSKKNITHCEILFEIELFVINAKEHTCFALFICSILLLLQIALLTINLGYCQIAILHACAMFRIVGIILQSLFNKEELCCKINEDVISATLNRAINYHNRVIQFIKSINSVVDLSCIISMIFGTIILGTDIVMFDLNKNNISVFLTTLFYVGGIAFIAFFQGHVGQTLSDHSTEVFQETITQPWYLLPPKYQKFSILIMMRSMKQCSLVVSKIWSLSYDFFSQELKTAVSYALIFHSLKNN